MDNQNPSEMTNQDLENQMAQQNTGEKGNQEKVKKSTAAEGDLISPEDDKNSTTNIKPVSLDDERDGDDLVHSSADEDSQDGSLPDPEELDNWERREDQNKISG